MIQDTDDLRIQSLHPLLPPAILIEEHPLTEQAAQTVAINRRAAQNIIRGQDDRLLIIVGPCSIHDPKAAIEYAHKLLPLKHQLKDDLLIIMRVYFEKPRTTIGWKGLINDPDINGQFRINHGLRLARKLLLDLAQIGCPAATEFLDTIIPQFIADLITWGAIGARTTESQIHRELASGLSMPVGFKNGTDGNTQIAIDAIGASRQKHHFLSVTKQGLAAIVETRGNDTCHLILRGSNHGPNYDPPSITNAAQQLQKRQLPPAIMIDTSHGNSNKDHRQQPTVANNLAQQIHNGNHHIRGIMIESHLQPGKQTYTNPTDATYGQSITDACLSWQDTQPLLHTLAQATRHRRQHPPPQP